MSATQRGTKRLDTWLSQLLWAIAKKNGGELRVSGYELDDVPARCAISTDYDPTDHSIVVRAGTGISEMIVINTEQQWATSQRAETEESSRNSSANSSREPSTRMTNGRGVVVSDELAAAIEERLNQRIQLRHRQNQEAEVAKVARGEF